MKKENKKKYAIVTGCNGSIGKSICKRLSTEGYEVIGIDMKNIHLKSLHSFIKFDLDFLSNSEKSCHELHQNILRIIGSKKVDLLVNNAAIQAKDSLKNFTLSNWKRTLSVNLEAPLMLIKLLMKNFSRDSLIVNISSVHATLTKPNFLSYSVSKAALSSLTRALAINHGDSLRFISIEPAAIDTKMLKAGFGENFNELMPRLKKVHPTNSIGKPSDIAELILAISSKNLKFLNGSIIRIDGGISSRLHDPE